MLRFLSLIAIVFSIVYLVSNNSFGGLIDYERLNRARKAQADGIKPDENPDAASFPKWMIDPPRVDSRENKTLQVYDINRDNILQTAEVKTYLRDVLDIVDQKGGYTIDTALLKEYDRNRDGIISRIEVAPIKQQVRSQ